jgi:hypothetical protein
LAWEQFHANAQGLDPAELLERERLALALVAGRLDLPAWLAGETVVASTGQPGICHEVNRCGD